MDLIKFPIIVFASNAKSFQSTLPLMKLIRYWLYHILPSKNFSINFFLHLAWSSAASKHLQGPLDGSLYATILKSPKSPQHSPPQLSLPSTPAKPIRTSSQQNLISPPPEFSSPKIIVSAHNSSSSTVRNSTPVPRKDPVQTIPRAYSQPPVRKPGTPQPPERHSSTHVVHNYPPNQTQIRVIEEYRYKTQDNTANGNVPSSSRTQTTEHDGRESVRSPLTLSMDSGISSSGIVNSKWKCFYELRI